MAAPGTVTIERDIPAVVIDGRDRIAAGPQKRPQLRGRLDTGGQSQSHAEHGNGFAAAGPESFNRLALSCQGFSGLRQQFVDVDRLPSESPGEANPGPCIRYSSPKHRRRAAFKPRSLAGWSACRSAGRSQRFRPPVTLVANIRFREGRKRIGKRS
ncbi:hypothetical protein NIIDMKKI_29670 [Mycobacterium kansasii]|uniref:Uncharacterized protein n=1 Tax=Mycobacterium kansasii TaxID=1768 RepID=A0A7G1I9R0_MYCKA|nr:hypothetical protein NIIDMKKI_29670 [Mycobacterium kansasii]